MEMQEPPFTRHGRSSRSVDPLSPYTTRFTANERASHLRDDVRSGPRTGDACFSQPLAATSICTTVKQAAAKRFFRFWPTGILKPRNRDRCNSAPTDGTLPSPLRDGLPTTRNRFDLISLYGPRINPSSSAIWSEGKSGNYPVQWINVAGSVFRKRRRNRDPASCGSRLGPASLRPDSLQSLIRDRPTARPL